MQKTLVLICTSLSLSACANATRTFPVPTIEQRSINLFSNDQIEYKERPPLAAPIDRQTLLPPTDHKLIKQAPSTLSKNYRDPVVESWKKNNYIR
jgi:hypothetical protein